jgi:hypothetical protein
MSIRIRINKPLEILTIRSDRIEYLSVIMSVSGNPVVVATLDNGKKEVLCNRATTEACISEVDGIHNAEATAVKEERDDVMIVLPYWPPKEKPKPEEKGAEAQPGPEATPGA